MISPREHTMFCWKECPLPAGWNVLLEIDFLIFLCLGDQYFEKSEVFDLYSGLLLDVMIFVLYICVLYIHINKQ